MLGGGDWRRYIYVNLNAVTAYASTNTAHKPVTAMAIVIYNSDSRSVLLCYNHSDVELIKREKSKGIKT